MTRFKKLLVALALFGMFALPSFASDLTTTFGFDSGPTAVHAENNGPADSSGVPGSDAGWGS